MSQVAFLQSGLFMFLNFISNVNYCDCIMQSKIRSQILSATAFKFYNKRICGPRRPIFYQCKQFSSEKLHTCTSKFPQKQLYILVMFLLALVLRDNFFFLFFLQSNTPFVSFAKMAFWLVKEDYAAHTYIWYILQFIYQTLRVKGPHHFMQTMGLYM